MSFGFRADCCHRFSIETTNYSNLTLILPSLFQKIFPSFFLINNKCYSSSQRSMNQTFISCSIIKNHQKAYFLLFFIRWKSNFFCFHIVNSKKYYILFLYPWLERWMCENVFFSCVNYANYTQSIKGPRLNTNYMINNRNESVWRVVYKKKIFWSCFKTSTKTTNSTFDHPSDKCLRYFKLWEKKLHT